MKSHHVSAAIALAAIIALGCRGDVTAADAEDALALDSMLQKQVLAAQGDTAPVIEEVQEVIRPIGPAPRSTARAATPVAGSAAPAAPVAPQAAPAVTRPVAPPARQPATRPAESPASVAAEPVARPGTTARKAAPLRSTVTVPPGTRLSLVSSERVCVTTARVGERVSARTSSRLTGPMGTVIPAGAPAAVVVTSLTGPLGEERILLDVRSISVGGKSYPISSRVTDIELDRRAGAERCLPDGGEIDARLTSSLRIDRDS